MVRTGKQGNTRKAGLRREHDRIRGRIHHPTRRRLVLLPIQRLRQLQRANLAFSNILIGFSAYASPRLATKFGQMRAIILTTGSSMLFMLSMAFIPIFALAAGVYIVRAALMNMAGPLMDSFSMSIFPAEQRGLVSALSNITFRLPNSLSTYFGGFILGLGLLQLPFFIASIFYITGLTAFYIFFVATKRYAAQIASLS